MLRVGMVGLGKMGLSHLAMVRAHPDVELVSACDSMTYLTDVLGKYTGLKDAYKSLHEALVQMKKHLMHYSSGWPGARFLRTDLFGQRSPEGVREVFWSRLRPLRPVAEHIPADVL